MGFHYINGKEKFDLSTNLKEFRFIQSDSAKNGKKNFQNWTRVYIL